MESNDSGPQRRRDRRATTISNLGGRLLMITGVIVIFLGYFIFRSHMSAVIVRFAVGFIVALFGAVLFGVGAAAVVRARMDRAATAQEALANDARAPVLYLRSFKDDSAAAKLDDWGTRSDEEQMSAVLRRIGPIVAVGDPKERRVTLGANRIYLSDDEWQDWVKSQMLAAALVIFRASDTDAFWWEVATAALHVPDTKVAFLLPNDARIYDEFRQRFVRHFAQPLPPSLPAQARAKPPAGFWGLMYFNDAGKPVFRSWLAGAKLFTAPGIVDWIRWILGFRYGSMLEPQYRYLLRPLLERVGAPTRSHPTFMGVAILCTAGLPLIVPYLFLGLIVRRIRGKSSVALLPGWSESR
jgi:hypothetical protein